MAVAFLVIDLQAGMFGGGGEGPIDDGEALLRRVRGLLERARAARVPVIHVRHDGGEGDMLEYGSEAWQLRAEVRPLDGETIVDKRTPDAFHRTTLGNTLAGLGVRRLIVAGAQTEFCIDTTCRRAVSLGYDVTLVTDGHGTWDNGVLTADQIVRHTNRTLSMGFVRGVTADDVRFTEAADRRG